MNNNKLKNILLVLVFVVIFGMIIGISCSLFSQKSSYHVVTFRGVESAGYGFRSPVIYLTPSAMLSGEDTSADDELHLAVSANELIITDPTNTESLSFYWPHTNKENKVVSIKKGEDIKIIFHDDSPAVLYLESESSVWGWLEKQEDSTLKDIQSIVISDELNDQQLDLLKRVGDVNQHLGVYCLDSERLVQLSGIINPGWLYLEDENFEDSDIALFETFSNCKMLAVDLSGMEDISCLEKLDNLEALIVRNWDSDGTNFPAVSDRLKVFSINDSKLEDLSVLGSLKHVTELNINSSLESLSGLEQFTKLSALTIGYDKSLDELFLNKAVRRLKRLTVSKINGNSEIEALSKICRDMEVLEIMDCTDDVSLAPLQKLKKLKVLSIFNLSGKNKRIDYESIKNLKTLQILGLNPDLFDEDNRAAIQALQEALPDCHIVPAGFCLGSRWILLLLLVPLIGFGIAAIRSIRKKIMSGNTGNGK